MGVLFFKWGDLFFVNGAYNMKKIVNYYKEIVILFHINIKKFMKKKIFGPIL